MQSLSMRAMDASPVRRSRFLLLLLLLMALLFLGMPEALAHAVAEGDKGFIQESSGVMVLPFIYMGAKHMITGYDHLLFLYAVIFFLYRMKDVTIYVTLFAVGHIVTLLSGVLMEISISSYIIDAIIGFSVVYKALDNMGAYQRWFGFQPNTKAATLIFGLLHGFGFAGALAEIGLPQGDVPLALLTFNLGVEIGQLVIVAVALAILHGLRQFRSRWVHPAKTALSYGIGMIATYWFIERMVA